MEEIKIKLGIYEISIKARNTLLQADFNEEETKALLNRLSFVFGEAAEALKLKYEENPDRKYLPRIAEMRLAISHQIYEQLDEMHFYDDVRKEATK